MSSRWSRPLPLPSTGPAAAAHVASRGTMEDEALVAAVLRGDERAAPRLHDRARPRVALTIHRLFGGASPAAAEHLARESMVAVVYSLPRYRSEYALDAWIGAVTAKVVLNRLRRGKRDGSVLDLDLASNGERQVGPLDAHDFVRRLRAHLQEMPEKNVWTFVLHGVYGYGLREIAEITGESSASAQRRVAHTRQRIRERVAAEPKLARLLESLEEA